MSYDYRITSTREISISPGALTKLRWEFDLQRGIPEELIQVLEREFSIRAEVSGYTAEGEPVFSFELMHFPASEHDGLQGVIEQLKEKLKYAESQSFELFDETGAYLRYDHLGRYNREDY